MRLTTPWSIELNENVLVLVLCNLFEVFADQSLKFKKATLQYISQAKITIKRENTSSRGLFINDVTLVGGSHFCNPMYESLSKKGNLV